VTSKSRATGRAAGAGCQRERREGGGEPTGRRRGQVVDEGATREDKAGRATGCDITVSFG
jgi:hypothetical protein